MANIVATGIAYAKHLTAFDDMAKQRIDGIDLTPLMMYVIDTTDVDALPFLAEQFHVLGWEGWALAVTEQDRRNLIKRAIELHKFKGTPWSIKNALKAVGFGAVTISEGVGFDYNGEQTFDGTNNYQGGHWANFRVKVEVPDDRPMTEGDLTTILAMILEYKNVRSHLVDVSYIVYLQDEITNEDELDFLVGDETSDTMTFALNYDAAGNYNGSFDYDQSNDPGSITITISGVSTTEDF